MIEIKFKKIVFYLFEVDILTFILKVNISKLIMNIVRLIVCTKND